MAPSFSPEAFTGLSEVFTGVGDFSFQGRRRSNSGRTQEYIGVRVPHPPLEIPVGRGQDILPVRRNPAMDSHAGSASRGEDHGPGLHQRPHHSFFHGLQEDRPGGGDDTQPHVGGNPLALENGRGGSQVFQPSIRASPDHHFVDRGSSGFFERNDVVHLVGFGDLRLQPANLVFQGPAVNRIGIRLYGFDRPRRPV